jgi:hypothetical protein
LPVHSPIYQKLESLAQDRLRRATLGGARLPDDPFVEVLVELDVEEQPEPLTGTRFQPPLRAEHVLRRLTQPFTGQDAARQLLGPDRTPVPLSGSAQYAPARYRPRRPVPIGRD